MESLSTKGTTNHERGSLSLEHILFIGAVVALTVGVSAFYNNMSTYFSNVGFGTPPSNFGNANSGNSGQ